jgi:serine O-acetyltransferase
MQERDGMFENVKMDIKRYIATDEAYSLSQKLNLFFFNFSLWAILSYRFGRWVRHEFHIPIVKPVLKVITRVVHALIGLLTGIQLPFETVIGPGFYIGHTGTLVFNSKVTVGAHCAIGIGCVIGQGGRGENKGSPIIGDYVYVGVGAKLIGNIRIGNGCAIGANAVVTHDLPPNVTAAGIPARIINHRGSSDFIKKGI